MAIYVYGATAQAKMTIDLLERLHMDIAGCIDKSLLLNTILDYPVILNHIPSPNDSYVLAIRNVGLRKRMFEDLNIKQYPIFIHPEACISAHADLEEGTVVFAHVMIGPDVQVGRQVLLDAGAIVHSNSVIEDFVNIGANVSIGSNVLVGEGAEIGANSVIGDEVTIEAYSMVPPHTVIL
ncbi:hypothetical protein [Sphingobacterium suaedae]|uniref:Mannose-1-phosphate guanyltransferase C-terminal domain-containing protein n=1 Tax=Sphingobacterium suaedae TaxID=1686402 RepID=A0ABW5KHX7_9SPHI